jgi:hypothetical protein
MTTKYDSQCKHTKYDVRIYNDNTQNINKDTKLQTYNNTHNYQLQSTYKCMHGVDIMVLCSVTNKCM